MQTVEKKSVNYEKMVQMADEAFACLNNGNYELIGRMIHENWLLKKTLSEGVSNRDIDLWYDKAMSCGALGGKIIGAGGGGFMLFMADPSKHNDIMSSIPELTRQEFSFESEGSRIIYVGD
jgi:D-glycero-alpha-D-manno-heptose-7-phosphate kinase